jgi:hypothetical protein
LITKECSILVINKSGPGGADTPRGLAGTW